MKYLFLLLLCFSASAADRFVQVTTNGALVSPTDFFTVNSNLIVSAISGAFGTGSGSGDVVGPFSAPDGALVVFDGTTGKLIRSATVTESQILTESEASSFYAPLNSPAFTGTVTFDSGTFGTLTITTNLFVADVAYGAGWDTSTNVPTRNAVYDKIQSLLTLFQGTNANLTTLATLNGGALTNLDGSKIASGQIPIPTATKTANYSPTVLENNTWFNNSGASGAVTNTLPAAFAGRQYGFVILAAQQLVIKAAGSDTIRILGTVSAGGGQAATNVVGTTLHLHCPVDGVWVADSQVGAWAVQ